MAKRTFEQSLAVLEKIVDELETGDLPLEKALKKFDEGMNLSRQCSAMLDATEKKVTQLLVETLDSERESPFEIDPEEDPDEP